MITKLQHSLALLLILAASAIADDSHQLRFLINSSMPPLPDAQAQQLKQQLGNALDRLEDRQQQYWRSEDGQTRARIEPLLSYNNGEQQCRKTELQLQRQGLSEQQFRFELCRQAEGWTMMTTPASGFDTEDWSLLNRALQQTLNNNTDQQGRSWKNHRSRNGGQITPLNHQMVSGLSCRQADIELTNPQGNSSYGSYLFCKNSEGLWRRHLH